MTLSPSFTTSETTSSAANIPIEVRALSGGFRWELWAYVAIFTLALLARLCDLAARAYHYDEAIHAFDSWQLLFHGVYHHSPWTHGPLLYEASALSMGIFGDNLVGPRIIPALLGSGLVLLPALLRGYLGKWGALTAAVLLAFSPSLLYFSRFLRHDIFAIFFDLLLVACLWRFLSTKKNRYLYLGALALVLSFASEETAYINILAVGSFFCFWWLRSKVTGMVKSKTSRRMKRLSHLLRGRPLNARTGTFFFFAGLVLPLFAAGVGKLIQHIPHLGLIMVLPQENNSAGIVGTPVGLTANIVAGLIVGTLFVIGAGLALRWRFGVWASALGLFYAVFILLHTTFLTNMVGLGSGFWQSLGYWLAQQPVERANEPWYYYLMTLSLYEFLPLLLGIAAIFWAVGKRGATFSLTALVIAVIAGLLAAILYKVIGGKWLYAPLGIGLGSIVALGLGRGSKFEWFLVHWTLVTLLLYIVAGEKMPWLTTHLVLPLILLAAVPIGRALVSICWPVALKSAGVVLLASIPVLAWALYALVTHFGKDSLEGRWGFVGSLVFTVLFFLAAWVICVRTGARLGVALVTISLVLFLGLFSLRTAFQASYAHADNPVELFLYSQTGPEVQQVAARIDAVARQSGKGEKLTILADTSGAALAQWRWYLRNYKDVSYQDVTTSSPKFDYDVVLLGDTNVSKLDAVKATYSEGVRVNINQWFNPFLYKGYTAEKFAKDVRHAWPWTRILHYFVYRTDGPPPLTQQAYAYFNLNLPKNMAP